MRHRIDISEPLKEICDRLGIQYDCVRELHFEPSAVRAEVYELSEHGSKWVDETTGEAVTATLEFEVKT